MLSHAREAVKRMLRLVTSPLNPIPARFARVTSEYQQSHLLASSPAFDHELYAAAKELTDESPFGSALNYLRQGVHEGHGLHPLIEPAFFPHWVRQVLYSGDVTAFVDYLRTPEAGMHAWGPLFDPSAETPDITNDTSAWERFVGLGPDDPVPTPNDFMGPAPTLREAKVAALEHASKVRDQRSFRTAPMRSDWDADAERTWISSILTSSPAGGQDSDPVVSIITPVWNRKEQVIEAIASVQSQTLQRWEMIVVDDGSDDGTYEALLELAAQDARIVPRRIEHGGVCAARNAGLDAVRGAFVAFLDSDNRWTPDFLDYATRALSQSDDIGVYSALKITDIDGETRYRGGQVDESDLLIENAIDMNALLVRRSALDEIGGFDESLRRWVDYDLVLRLARLGRLQYLPFIGCYYSNTQAVDRITMKESVTWRFKVAEKAIVDWDRSERGLASRPDQKISIIITMSQDGLKTIRAIDDVLATTSNHEIEVIVIDDGAPLIAGRFVANRFASHPNVVYHRLPRPYGRALAANVGFTLSTGRFVVFLDNHVEVRGAWLEELITVLRDDPTTVAAQPLLTAESGQVASAGYLFTVDGERPSPFLMGHPAEDAYRATEDIAAFSGAGFAMRAETFHSLRGFDTLFRGDLAAVDLSLRTTRRFGGRIRRRSRSRVILTGPSSGLAARVVAHEVEDRRIFLERWNGALPSANASDYTNLGFDQVGVVPDTTARVGSARPLIIRRPRFIVDEIAGRIPSLRWAIKIGAENSRGGDMWGDVPFAADLAAALEERGQEVVVDRYGAFDRPTSYLDDVILTIRGKHAASPQPGRINALWVISRPELVTIAEVQSYDLVFAASSRWADWMQKRSGKSIAVLLQATRPDRFHDRSDHERSRRDILFVGGPRRTEGGRKVVQDALAVGAELALWGPGWSRVAPQHMARGEYLPFEALPGAYRNAAVVLNDHMPTMAEWGFVNNRTFDVVASGTPVISDQVDGLELFEGAVATYRDQDELRDLVGSHAWAPSPEKMRQIALRVRQEHSFTARADALLTSVLEHKAASSG